MTSFCKEEKSFKLFKCKGYILAVNWSFLISCQVSAVNCLTLLLDVRLGPSPSNLNAHFKCFRNGVMNFIISICKILHAHAGKFSVMNLEAGYLNFLFFFFLTEGITDTWSVHKSSVAGLMNFPMCVSCLTTTQIST